MVRAPELERMVGLSRSTILRLEKRGEFPKRVRLSRNAKGWVYREVILWLEERERERDGDA
jgi:prophage regulatory protein